MHTEGSLEEAHPGLTSALQSTPEGRERPGAAGNRDQSQCDSEPSSGGAHSKAHTARGGGTSSCRL